MNADPRSWKDLFKDVIEAGLCTLCGACCGFCPYLVYYRGRVIALDNCAREEEAQCYEYCPRTYTNLDILSQTLFNLPYHAESIGVVKSVVIARSTDTEIKARAQYGGVVTSILSFALQNGMIDGVILAKTSQDKIPYPFLARNIKDLMHCTGSNYMACPVLEGYNQLTKHEGNNDRLALVGMPCQVLAIAKMRCKPPRNKSSISNVKFVIGLFCTWALSPDSFHKFLKEKLDLTSITKLDIPPPPANRFDIYSKSGRISYPLEEIKQFTLPACAYCFDMASEFADISVGAAEGIEGWNTVIIRTETGSALWQSMVDEGRVEVGELPTQNLNHLKEAALLKKKRAVNELIKRSGNTKDLLYLGLSPEQINKLIS